jgi:AraC-like DNA-binding protein
MALAKDVWAQYGLRLSVVILQHNALHEIPLSRHPANQDEVCRLAKLLPSGRHTCDRCDPEELTRTFARTMTRAFCLADLTTLASIHGSFDTDPAVLLLGTTRRFRCAPLLGNPPWQIKANELAIGQQGMQRIRALYEDMPVMTRETLRQLGGMVDDLAREVQGSLDGMPFGKIKLSQPLVNRSTGWGNSATKLVLLGPGIQIAPPFHPIGAAVVHLVRSIVGQWPHLPYSIKVMATAARITPNYFSTLYKKHTGKTFLASLADARLAKAQRLLRKTRHSIERVGKAIGIVDASYFGKWFTSRTGMSPSAWRRQSR